MSEENALALSDAIRAYLQYRIEEAEKQLRDYDSLPATSYETMRHSEGQMAFLRRTINVLRRQVVLCSPKTVQKVYQWWKQQAGDASDDSRTELGGEGGNGMVSDGPEFRPDDGQA